jgi:hypothetical protein
MVRTRDFLLFLIMIAFFVVVISAETARQWFGAGGSDASLVLVPTFTDAEPVSTSAEVVARKSIDRAGNIARLRARLASFVPPVEEPLEIISIPEATSPEDSVGESEILVTGSALLCARYRPYAGNWPNQLLTITEQEGVRVITDTNAHVVTVLPIRIVGTPLTPTCLSTDVVAVGQSGSLIRNADVAGYRAFPEHILIGYTLDGFPLYGNSSQETDQCGGAVVDGSYRYYLSRTRETVLDCFVAPPITLP